MYCGARAARLDTLGRSCTVPMRAIGTRSRGREEDGVTRHRNRRAFDAHIGAAHTIEFRKELQAFIGAPYDERLYEVAGRF